MIDDNPLDQLIVRRICEQDGSFSDLLFVNDARVILAQLQATGKLIPRQPDIILLDLNMPILSGWEFLSQYSLFYQQLTKPVDIYVLSSSIDDADRELALAYPFVKDFFIKPMTTSLMKTLRDRYAA
jgi:CheY-like chemotaxis protein